jgi:hypothetical protein
MLWPVAWTVSAILGATPATPTPARVTDIISNADRLSGYRIRVDGDIYATSDPRLFTLAPLQRATPFLLVVVPTRTVSASLEASRRVVVSGRLWLHPDVVLAQWPELEPLRAAIARFGPRPLIVGESIRSSAGVEIVAAPAPVRTIERIVASTDRPSLVGREVTLKGVTVHVVIGPRMFIVRDGAGRQLLVQGDDDAPPHGVASEARVDVQGVIHAVSTAVFPWGLLPVPDRQSGRVQLYVRASRVAAASERDAAAAPSELPQ